MKNSAITVLVLVISIVNCNKYQKDDQNINSRRKRVKVISVSPSEFVDKGVYYGRLVPLSSVRIVSYSGGRVESIKVREGDLVQKGESLAEIDADKASTLLQTAQVQERIALSTLEQNKIHLENGNASRLRVDEAEMNYTNAKNNRINSYDNYRGALAITPISGIVTARFIQKYDEIAEGTHVFTVSKMDEMKMNIDISESDIYYLEIGTTAQLFIDMIPARNWIGEVRTFAREADETTRAFRTEIYFDNRDGLLKPGITGRVEIDLQHFDSVIVIPTELISVQGLQKSVMVVNRDDKVEKRFIETGPQSDSLTLVYEGLTFGECIITEGQNLVSENDEVIIENNRKN